MASIEGSHATSGPTFGAADIDNQPLTAIKAVSQATTVMLDASAVLATSGENTDDLVDEVQNDADAKDSSDDTESPSNDDELGFPFENWDAHPFYFAFTPICPSSAIKQSCDGTYQEIERDGPSHLDKDDWKKAWGLHPMLEKFIIGTAAVVPADPKAVMKKLSEIADAHYDLQEVFVEAHQMDKERERTCTVVCPPCRVAIRSALMAGQEYYRKKLKYIVRIDDRLPASCCPEHKKLGRLQSLAHALVELDQGELKAFDDAHLLKIVDRPYLDQRIYDLQMKEYQDKEPSSSSSSSVSSFSPVEQMSQLLGEHTKHPGTVVYLAEASACSWIVDIAPFEWSTREVQGGQLFRFTPDKDIEELTREFLGTFTCVPPPKEVGEDTTPVFRSEADRRRLLEKLGLLSEKSGVDLATEERHSEGESTHGGNGDNQESSPERIAKRRRLV